MKQLARRARRNGQMTQETPRRKMTFKTKRDLMHAASCGAPQAC